MKFHSALLSIFLLGVIGSFIELVLLDHTEDLEQLIPLILIGFSIILIIWLHINQSELNLKIFRIMMILFMLSGVLGVWYHYQGNLEFILEMYPTESGFRLFWKTIKGATPVLAPGTITLLGLIGYLYTMKIAELIKE